MRVRVESASACANPCISYPVRRLLEPFVSLPFDDRAADHYGVARATLEQAGTPIGANDLLIASIALAHDCLLVTRHSREFERVVGLRVAVWS